LSIRSATARRGLRRPDGALEVGQVYQIRGTVKAHRPYRDVMETIFDPLPGCSRRRLTRPPLGI